MANSESQGNIEAQSRSDTGLVHIASIDWTWWWARQQQLTLRLSQRRKTLFVERLLALDSLVKRRRIFRRVSANTWALSPYKLLPFESRSRSLYQLNRLLLALMLRLTLMLMNVRSPILFFTDYDDHGLPARVPHRLVVYDCVDLHESFPWARGDEIAIERRLLIQSDLVIASSRQLIAKLRTMGVEATLVKNAADVPFFKTAREPGATHPALAGIPEPRIGFIGYLADHLDLDLMDYLANQQPQWSLVLVGRRTARQHPLFQRPNVFYLGEIPYDELPEMLRGINVCMIPFALNPLTEAADTIKLYEYLAAGKPVVSTNISQARELSRFVSVAGDREEFLQAIAKQLESGRPPISAELDEMLKESDWDLRTHQVETLFQSMLASESAGRSHAKPS